MLFKSFMAEGSSLVAGLDLAKITRRDIVNIACTNMNKEIFTITDLTRIHLDSSLVMSIVMSLKIRLLNSAEISVWRGKKETTEIDG